ncbi:hypothetical protein RRG08_009596 [Elysia crispata]|uniref:Uncharacterized protein n=1 Tax=Elysia crispata TaxID=231223 RepID=A0AAE0XTE5_9GAST|nr:hypothetical protein RRG08_009596 [Elysia crispata]
MGNRNALKPSLSKDEAGENRLNIGHLARQASNSHLGGSGAPCYWEHRSNAAAIASRSPTLEHKAW